MQDLLCGRAQLIIRGTIRQPREYRKCESERQTSQKGGDGGAPDYPFRALGELLLYARDPKHAVPVCSRFSGVIAKQVNSRQARIRKRETPSAW